MIVRASRPARARLGAQAAERPTLASARGEVWFLAGAAVVLLGVCGLPYLLAAHLGPADQQRIGTFWFSTDFSQYQAAMREGAAQPGWLIHDHLTAEPHAAALMFPLYVAAGKLAAVLNVSQLAVFGGLEWLGRLSVLASVSAFAATFLDRPGHRRLATLLCLGTLGLDVWAAPLGWLLGAIGLHGLAGNQPAGITPYLEVASFGVLFSAPHLMFGLALTLGCAPLALRAVAGGRGWLAGLFVAALGLSLVHPFNTPVLLLVLAAWATTAGRRAWLAVGVVGLAVAPMAIVSLLVYQRDPFWSATYADQNLMPAPPVWALPGAFGLVLCAAPLAWPVVQRLTSGRRRLLLAWVGLGLACMYVPVPYQRRFGLGVQPGLAVLASMGLFELNDRMRVWRWGRLRRRLVNDAALLAGSSATVLVYVSLLSSAMLNAPAEVSVWSRSEAEAADWIEQHSTASDVVLASTAFGNPLAGSIDGRVVAGHPVATLHSEHKAEMVRQFFAPETNPARRQALLDESGATLVVLGPREQTQGVVALANDLPSLRVVYARSGVEVYQVVPVGR